MQTLRNSGLRVFILFLLLGLIPAQSNSEEFPKEVLEKLMSKAGTAISVVVERRGLEKAEKRGVSEPTIESVDFSQTIGWRISLSSGNISVSLSVFDDRLVRVVDQENSLRVLPELGHLHESTGEKKLEWFLRDYQVVPLAEAQLEAISVIKKLFGDGVLGNMALEHRGLSRNGSRIGYLFSWRLDTEENGVSQGFDLIRIWVNPESGKFHSVSRSRFLPESPRISPRKAREIAQEKLDKEDQQKSISSLTLIPLYDQSGSAQPCWKISIKQNKPALGFDSFEGSMFLDADSGEMLDDPQVRPRLSSPCKG